MTKAPERIWAFLDGPFVGMFVSGGIKDGGTEYLRADHALAPVAAAWQDGYWQGANYTVPKPPDDATAALKARDQRIRNEALREVVKVCDELRPATTSSAFEDGYDSGLGTAVVHIEALITEGQSDGE